MPVTARLEGGLGNQLFQIATGYAFSKKLGTDFFLIQNDFGNIGQGNVASKYYDTIYKNLNFKQLSDVGALKVHAENHWHYYPIQESVEDPSLQTIRLEGYFQSERHFADCKADLRRLFSPDLDVREYLASSTDLEERFPELFMPHDFCYIGVRRGDYIARAACHNPCGMTYYKAAMAALPASRYYIASDDIPWCRKNFVGDQYVFLDIDDDLTLFYLGTLFPKYIISNSSFHWWISYLSIYDAARVIAPDKWIFGASAPRAAYDSIYRDDMIVLERPVEVD